MAKNNSEDLTSVDNSKYKDGVNRNARLIFRNVSFKATEEGLREYFSQYGTVEEVTLLKKPDGKLVGCGFVHYTHVPMANKALTATNKKPFLGRPLFVSWAVSKQKFGEVPMSGKEVKKRLNSGSTDEEPKEKIQKISNENTEAGKDNKQKINRNARLIVRNVSFKATEETLKEHFAPYGELLEVKLLKKPDGKLVGCAFVHYKNVPMAKQALLSTNMKPFLGRPISVDWAVAKDKYMQHVVNQQLEMQEDVKKEDSDDEDDDVQPMNISNDDVKAEVKSESEEDSDAEKDSGSDEDSEKSDSEGDNDEDESGEEEDEDDDDDDVDLEDGNESDVPSETSTQAEKKRIRLNDAEDGHTVFVSNIPFSVDSSRLRSYVEEIAPVKYALVCTDKLTDHSKGTGFIKFDNKEDAQAFLARSPEQLKLEGQTLQARPALLRDNLAKGGAKVPKDNRNLYLVKEGVIVPNTKAAEGVSASDMAKRRQLEKSKTQMLKNLNRFVSRYRLVVSNLPEHYTDSKLRSACAGGAGRGAVVTEARVMRDLRAPVGPDGLHPSKGYGFVMFTRHEDALACLRKLNNNPDTFGNKNNRPIVNFSIEDRTALNARKKRLEKSIANNPIVNKPVNKNDEEARKRKHRKRKLQAPDESYVKKAKFDKNKQNGDETQTSQTNNKGFNNKFANRNRQNQNGDMGPPQSRSNPKNRHRNRDQGPHGKGKGFGKGKFQRGNQNNNRIFNKKGGNKGKGGGGFGKRK